MKPQATYKIPELAQMALASARETMQTQVAVAQGDFQMQAQRISTQVFKDLGLDTEKKDYRVQFDKGIITEHPKGTLKAGEVDAPLPVKEPVNPAARRKPKH